MPSPEPKSVVLLSPMLANQIAAGEVVARPASVVKELCENSIDAGASRIRIEIEGGGVSLVRVIDDGSGMGEADARLAMSRHATSKIRTVDDLRAIATLGFRGEALPSIASVSKFLLRTRPASADAGVEIAGEGSEALSVKPCGAAVGTTVEVRDLFFNVPARRKFLRAVATESAHVSEVVRDLALAHHEVGIDLYRDGKTARRWLSGATRAERVATTFEGHELLPCRGERGQVKVEAFLSRPERARTGAAGLAIFVGGRSVRDRALARAVANAYGAVLERGRYPVGVLFVDVPLELVDVNVHPQKAEVRFAEPRAVSDAVYTTVAAAVEKGLDLPLGRKAAIWPSADPPDEPWSWRAWEVGQPETPELRGAQGYPDGPHPGPSPMPAPLHAAETAAGRRHLATLRGRFLLFDAGDRLQVVDGRRVQAVRLARELAAELARGNVVAQRLLFPIASRCDQPTADAALAASDALSRLGFELRALGPGQLAAHTVPRLLADGPAELLLADVLESVRRSAAPPFGIDAPALLTRLAELTAQAAHAPGPGELDDEHLREAIVHEIRFDELK